MSSFTAAPKPNSAKGARFAVDVRVLSAILKAAEFVCGQFGVQDLNMQKAERRRTGLPWIGEVGGEDHAALNDENLEAIGEITNMILGNAKSDFSQYPIEMTIP